MQMFLALKAINVLINTLNTVIALFVWSWPAWYSNTEPMERVWGGLFIWLFMTFGVVLLVVQKWHTSLHNTAVFLPMGM